MIRFWALGTVLTILAACGDDGDGTSGSTCGAGTHEVEGMCVPDDVATIGPVTGLTAAVNNGVVTLSWTNPTEPTLDSVLVVRRGSVAVVAAPAGGATYALGDSLDDGSSVVGTTMANSAMDPGAKPGLAFYAVYARDKAGNWSAPARVRAVLPVPAQTATISISLADGARATVTTQPAHFSLSTTAILDESDVVLQIRITSGVERPVFNTKLLVTATNQGTVAGTGELAGTPYVWFGRGAMLPGTTRQRSLRINDATGGADPIVLNVKIQDDPMLIANQLVQSSEVLSLVDTSTYAQDEPTCMESLADTASPTSNACSFTSGVLSADGRFLHIGYRNLPVLATFDTSTFQVVGGVELASGVGMVGAVAADPTGATLYAVVNTGQHGTYGGMTYFGRRAGQIDLVRLDAVTLAETGRLTLRTTPTGTTPPQAKDLAISPNGKLAAIPISGEDSTEVRVVDLATLTQLTPLDVSSGAASPRAVAFTADSRKLVIGYSGANGGTVNDGTITSADTTTWALTAIAPTTAVSNGSVARISRAPDGTMWVLRNHGAGLSVFANDLSSETQYQTEDGQSGGPVAVAFSPDGTKAFMPLASDELAVFSVASPTRQDLDSTAGAPVSNAAMSRVGGHFALITPF
ncbi:MAG: hypothetical protein SFX73_29580 [Kofleriaceae bacterium]|nr:hypothetical protein [Kofleriaceae bacterium]